MKIIADDTKPFQDVWFNFLLLKDFDWYHKRQLEFTACKCKVIHQGSASIRHNYGMNAIPLAPVLQETDLGVMVDEQLIFHSHGYSGG